MDGVIEGLAKTQPDKQAERTENLAENWAENLAQITENMTRNLAENLTKLGKTRAIGQARSQTDNSTNSIDELNLGLAEN